MSKFRSIVLAFLALCVLVSIPGVAGAATSNSLGINPRRDYVVNPGQTYKDTLYVTNLSLTDDLKITIDVIDFGAKDETGSPALLLTQKEPTRWSLKPYLTIPKQYTIAAGKSAEIPFTIAIPTSVGAGSYYSAIRYSTADTAAADNLSLTSSSVSLIFVRVPGEAQSQLRLEKFGAFIPPAEGPGGTYSTFYSASSPKYVAYSLQNLGNVAEQPTGSMLLTNMFGKQIKLYENANPNNNIVLIAQTRRFDLCLNESHTDRIDAATGRKIEETTCNTLHLAPGRYTAKLALVYGDNGNSSQDLSGTTTFWYLPLWFIVAVIAAIVLIVAGIWFIVRKLRRRRKLRSAKNTRLP